MKILNIFKNKNVKPNINTIPYDYDGYDIQFKSGITEPKLYQEINDLITNSKFNINSINEYKNLKKNSDEDEFFEFYDTWINQLIENDYIIHLDKDMGIVEFTNRINKLLQIFDEVKQLDVNNIVNKYKEEISKYSYYGEELDEKFNYDILEANIVVQELRKIGYELINFFTGFDNTDKMIIKISDIEKMKEYEKKLSN